MKVKVTEVYYVNEEKKEIGCILKLKDPYEQDWIFNNLLNVFKYGCHGNLSFQKQFGFEPDLKFPTKFEAVAKCHPNDEWDVKIGNKIAREKAAETKAQKEKIAAILADKEDEALKSLSTEQLKSMLQNM